MEKCPKNKGKHIFVTKENEIYCKLCGLSKGHTHKDLKNKIISFGFYDQRQSISIGGSVAKNSRRKEFIKKQSEENEKRRKEILETPFYIYYDKIIEVDGEKYYATKEGRYLKKKSVDKGLFKVINKKK